MLMLLTVACGQNYTVIKKGTPGASGSVGSSGTSGTDGVGCSVVQAENGAYIYCGSGENATQAFISNGNNGNNGNNGENGRDGAPGQDGKDNSDPEHDNGAGNDETHDNNGLHKGQNK